MWAWAVTRGWCNKMSASGCTKEPSSTVTASEGASSDTITTGEEAMSTSEAPSSSSSERAATGRSSSGSEEAGGSSTPCASEEEYVFYCKRPEWADVEPLPQDDGPYPVVRIAYTDKFRDVYDYMRAVIQSGEKSERVLELTMDAIDLNPANYTVWHYRRLVLQHLNSNLYDEMQYTAEIIADETKNYQVWYHRQKLVEWLNDPSQELLLTAAVLDDDGKNYHAWQHRQWVVRTFKLWDGELDFIEKLLTEDLRNNSAWNHRYFVVSNTESLSSEEILKRELEYAAKYIRRAPNNESPWNYLQGVCKGHKLGEQTLVRSLCDELLEKHIASPHLFSTLIDIYGEESAAGNKESLDKAVTLCHRLANEVDQIRVKYWQYMARRLTNNFPGSES